MQPFEDLQDSPLDPVYGMFEDEDGRICLTDSKGVVYVYDININSTGSIKMKMSNKFNLVNIRESLSDMYVRNIIKNENV